jgi:hypothetical protein
MGIEDFILGGAGLGLIYDKFTKDKKSSETVNPNAIPLGGPIQDPKVLANAMYGSDNTNVIQSKATLKHGGSILARGNKLAKHKPTKLY